MKLDSVLAIIGAVGAVVFTDGFRKAMFGEYSDGSPRSLSDCLNDEIISPEDRDHHKKKKGKKKNKR